MARTRLGSAASGRPIPGGLANIELLDQDYPADRQLMRSATFSGAIVASDTMPPTWTEPAPDPQGRSPGHCARSPATAGRSAWPTR